MKLLNNIRLKNKIILIIISISLFSAIAGNVVDYFLEMRQTKEQLIVDTQLHARLISEYCRLPLEFDYRENATEVLQKLNTLPRVRDGVLVNKNNEVYASFHKNNNEKYRFTSDFGEGKYLVDGNFILVREDVVSNGQVIGAVYLRSEIIWKNIMAGQALVSLLVISIMLVITFLMAYNLQASVSGPVINLTEKMKSIAVSNDYNQTISYSGKDEIGELYNSFQHMINQVSQRENEIITTLEKLKLSEERFRQLSDNSGEWIWEVDTEGKYTFSNPTVTKLLGYSVDEIVGSKYFYDLFDSDLKEELKEGAFKAFHQKITFNDFENKNIDKNGRVVWLSTSGVPMFNENGDWMGYRGVDVDITEQKIVEEELFKNQYFLSKAQEIGQIGTWELDIQKNILTWTEENYRIFGLPINTPLNFESFINCVHPEDRDFVNKEWATKMLTNNYDIEHRLLVHGKVKWVREKAEVEFDNHGNAIRAVGVTQDISDRKKAEAELIKAKVKAEESDHLKTAFLANMSHEIRTPMNGILGFIDLLQSPNISDAEQKHFLEIVNKSGERLLNTINDIIEISKIESGEIEVKQEAVHIYETMSFFHSFFSPETKRKNIDLNFVCNCKELSVLTDKNKLDSILTNLLKNAIKFTSSGSITCKCDLKGDFIEFCVFDTGPGIQKERLNAIFERFVQADLNITRGYEGSGLGLAISKAYAEMLGGKIWVESELGKGSSFYFTIKYLPVNDTCSEIKNEVPESNKNLGDKLFKLMIVEDDDISYTLVETFLSSKNFQLVHAHNGMEAVIKAMENSDLDLILMDLKMPVMDGIEATKQIRKENKNIPIIAQTAFALFGDKEKAINAGCNDYIAKPIAKNQLMAMIEKYI